MLVVMIIGLLIGLAIRMTGSKMNEAKEVAARATIEQTKTNLLTYSFKAGRYPTTEQGLKALVTKPQTEPVPRNWTQLDDRVPLDPWQNELQYRCPGKHNPKDFDLFSSGPDGNPDTEEDNIGNWEKPR